VTTAPIPANTTAPMKDQNKKQPLTAGAYLADPATIQKQRQALKTAPIPANATAPVKAQNQQQAVTAGAYLAEPAKTQNKQQPVATKPIPANTTAPAKAQIKNQEIAAEKLQEYIAKAKNMTKKERDAFEEANNIRGILTQAQWEIYCDDTMSEEEKRIDEGFETGGKLTIQYNTPEAQQKKEDQLKQKDIDEANQRKDVERRSNADAAFKKSRQDRIAQGLSEGKTLA